MVVFNNKKFRKTLNTVVKKKEFRGEPIHTKQKLYEMIGETLQRHLLLNL